MIRITLDNVARVTIDDKWNFSSNSELAMHSIHAYPAKFPAFIAQKAFDYAKDEGVNVQTVADIFCGCGTVALEAKLHNKNFWGCDINPVATLIARTKSQTYDVNTVKELFEHITKAYSNGINKGTNYNDANERIRYWFTEKSYNDLLRLKESIELCVEEPTYLEAFYCLFSSILKATSKWLTKSIKPQVDPNKKEINVWDAFCEKYSKFIQAIEQLNQENEELAIEISTENFLNATNMPKVDLIISSPPYVTSYEYADLHQLSALWLGYTDDYRKLRKGSIGSLYNSEEYAINNESLNSVGKEIVAALIASQGENSHVKSVARYYVDIQDAIGKCSNMLNDGGMVFFVVGDTEYKGVQIKNSEHLVQCLIDRGFSDIKAAKRRISNKLLTPYRDEYGRFSSDKTKRTIYHEEYIISGRMLHK